MKTIKPRQPQKGKRFSWARVKIDPRTMEWRLFRRSETTRETFFEACRFRDHDHRGHIARALRSMRNRLRDNVDTLDIANMGIDA